MVGPHGLPGQVKWLWWPTNHRAGPAGVKILSGSEQTNPWLAGHPGSTEINLVHGRSHIIDDIVKRYWGREPRDRVLQRARQVRPDLTPDGLRWVAYRLRREGTELPYYRWSHGYRPWSDAEHQRLLELAGKVRVKEIAEILQRSTHSIYQHAKRHGLALRRAGKTEVADTEHRPS